jgi:hypothetical protein
MCCVGEMIKKDCARLMIVGLNPTDSAQAYYTEFTNLWRCVCAGGCGASWPPFTFFSLLLKCTL